MASRSLSTHGTDTMLEEAPDVLRLAVQITGLGGGRGSCRQGSGIKYKKQENCAEMSRRLCGRGRQENSTRPRGFCKGLEDSPPHPYPCHTILRIPGSSSGFFQDHKDGNKT